MDAESFSADLLKKIDDDNQQRGIGAEVLAMKILGDNGNGVMSPGPCADLLNEWRKMKAAITTAELAASIRTDAEYALRQLETAKKLATPATAKADCVQRAADALERILEACNTELTDNSNREE